MDSTLKHFCHPEHPLRLKEDDTIDDASICYGCNKSVVGSPTFTCTSDGIDCRNFYLHKSCAELPTLINHYKHKHSLTLLPRPDKFVCDICHSRVTNLGYACLDCDFDACIVCVSVTSFSLQRELHHQGHRDHALKLQREALFECDACGVKVEDISYVCITCDFWIHKSCALSPLIIPAPAYHHHPLNLVYSIPEIHCYFQRYCNICKTVVYRHNWLYYCHLCTYFVHMKCATSTLSTATEIETDGIDNEPDVVQFPMDSEESLFDLIMVQCGKLIGNFSGGRGNSITMSPVPKDPKIIEKHWSHINHPLELLELTSGNENDSGDDERGMLICDGCLQPITNSYPLYYYCIQCHFFLHSFCATKLPIELPAGASPFHPQHLLRLHTGDKFYSFVNCGVCDNLTNGFFYHCETCDIKIAILCAFLPARIKHKSHKQHSLVQRPSSESICSVSRYRMNNLGYACETCDGFQMDLNCLFYPSMMKHKYDDLHPITLRYPPFNYEGEIYCEICEERVNNQGVLYHRSESDHSFHHVCLCRNPHLKLGGTIKHGINNETHTLALVLKSPRRNCPRHVCGICERSYKVLYFFECDGCGFLACWYCVIGYVM